VELFLYLLESTHCLSFYSWKLWKLCRRKSSVLCKDKNKCSLTVTKWKVITEMHKYSLWTSCDNATVFLKFVRNKQYISFPAPPPLIFSTCWFRVLWYAGDSKERLVESDLSCPLRFPDVDKNLCDKYSLNLCSNGSYLSGSAKRDCKGWFTLRGRTRSGLRQDKDSFWQERSHC
jgi:hypothetical protein